jgi:transcription antitermination protein NusB
VSRRVAREKALQSLYQIDMADVPVEEAIRHVTEDGGLKDLSFLRKLVTGTEANLERIDAVIGQYASGWELDRMASVDRNVLRLAVYELLHETDVPVSVVINEAVELAKAFSTPESGKFVNGVLGKIIRDLDIIKGSQVDE